MSLAGLFHRRDSPEALEQAAALYRETLVVDPENTMARHGLASLSGEPEPQLDEGYVRDLFDAYAPFFDKSLEALEYRAPDILADAVLRVDQHRIATAGFRYTGLDLGAGTGLACLALRRKSIPVDLAAVDLSSKMLARAEATGCYASIHVGEVTDHVSALPAASLDLVLAADVLVYLPSLDQLIAACARVLRSDGLLAFTVETHHEDSEGFTSKLLPTGRYAHSPEYIEDLAVSAGLQVKVVEKCVPRLDHGLPIDGIVLVFRKAQMLK